MEKRWVCSQTLIVVFIKSEDPKELTVKGLKPGLILSVKQRQRLIDSFVGTTI